MRRKRRGQVWSMDLIIAVVVFLLAIGVFYFFTQSRTNEDTSKLYVESQLIANKLTGDEQGSITNGTLINDDKLNDLIDDYTYDELKELLGIHDDFCIVLQDQDGNIILIGNSSTGNRVGLGKDHLDLTIEGVGTYSCGDAYS